MANENEKKVNRVILKHSFVKDKAPSAETMQFGELAVNCNEESPFLSTLVGNGADNTSIALVKFSSDDALTATFDERYASGSDITDLQGEIDNKADKTHSHGVGDINGKFDVDSLPVGTTSGTVASGDHTHEGVYQPKGDYVSASTITEIEGEIEDIKGDFNELVREIEQNELTIANSLNHLNTALDGKSDVGHTHDGYLNEADLTDIEGDIQSLENALSGKAASSHSHSASDITGSTKLSMNVIPTGTTNTTVAVGNHTHSDLVKSSELTSINSQIETINNTIEENGEVIGAALNTLNESIGNKQDAITDLETIRQGAAKGATALQSYTEQYKGTVTGVKINGTTKNPSSGVVDLGTVITAHQTLKTINGQSLIGSGNITISGGSSNANVSAVDTGDVLDDVNVDYATKTYVDNKVANINLTDYATKTYVDGLIGDINSILESIINGGE